MVKPSGQCLTAQPPEDITKKKTRRGPIKFRRHENWGLVEVEEEEAAPSAEGGSINLLLFPGMTATAHVEAFCSMCNAQTFVLCPNNFVTLMCGAVRGRKVSSM